MPAATIRRNQAPSVDERVPMAVYNPTDVSLLSTAGQINAWWDGEAGMMEGVQAGTVLSLKWKDYKNLQGLTPAVPGYWPGYGYDPVVKKSFLRFGFDSGRSRRTNTLANLRLVSGGSGYANGEVITLQNGVQVSIPAGAQSGGVLNSSGWTINNLGSFSSQPTAPLTQVSSTGSGTGATFAAEFSTINGSLALPPLPGVIPSHTFSILVAFRCPAVGGAAGADPGGFIFGAQLNQAEIINTTANNRYWGLRLGRPGEAGRLIGHIEGDSKVAVSPSGVDYRDNNWHVVMQTYGVGASGTCRLWADGVNLIGHTGGTFSAINTTIGTDMLRVGAAGLPSTGPTGGAALDVGAIMVSPYDLSATGNAALRQTIQNRLLATWRLGGVSA